MKERGVSAALDLAPDSWLEIYFRGPLGPPGPPRWSRLK